MQLPWGKKNKNERTRRGFRNNLPICQLTHQNTDNCCQLMQSEIATRNIIAENPGGSIKQIPAACLEKVNFTSNAKSNPEVLHTSNQLKSLSIFIWARLVWLASWLTFTLSLLSLARMPLWMFVFIFYVSRQNKKRMMLNINVQW